MNSEVKEKSFMVFGCGGHLDLWSEAVKIVEGIYAKKGKKAVYYDYRRHMKPDALLCVSRHMFIKDAWTLTTMKGKLIKVFVLKLAKL